MSLRATQEARSPWWCRWCGNDKPGGAVGNYCSSPCLSSALDDAIERRERAHQDVMEIRSTLAVRRRRGLAA